MTEKLSTQMQLVLEQKRRRFEHSVQAGDHLDNKATALLQVGGLVITLTGVVKIPDFVANPSPLGIISIAIAFLTFVGMIVLAVLAWAPSDLTIPGSDDWDEIFERYMHREVEDCFNQILADLLEAIEKSTKRNQEKARFVNISAGLFVVQIAGVLLLALVA